MAFNFPAHWRQTSGSAWYTLLVELAPNFGPCYFFLAREELDRGNLEEAEVLEADLALEEEEET